MHRVGVGTRTGGGVHESPGHTFPYACVTCTGFALVMLSYRFPSNGVATDPMTVFFCVFLTHLNTDALYFR